MEETNLQDIKVGNILEVQFSFGGKGKYLVLSISNPKYEEFYFKLLEVKSNKIYKSVLMFNNERCGFHGRVKII